MEVDISVFLPLDSTIVLGRGLLSLNLMEGLPHIRDWLSPPGPFSAGLESQERVTAVPSFLYGFWDPNSSLWDCKNLTESPLGSKHFNAGLALKLGERPLGESDIHPRCGCGLLKRVADEKTSVHRWSEHLRQGRLLWSPSVSCTHSFAGFKFHLNGC